MGAFSETNVGTSRAHLELPERYLAYAGVAPPSGLVKQEVARLLQRTTELGGGIFPILAAERELLRVRVAGLLGTVADNIAFVPGTTFGIRDLAFSLPWKAGDEVVLFAGEFPANVTPWLQAAELFGLRIHFVSLAHAIEDPSSFLVPLEARLARGVRLVAMSAVQFQTGLRMPLAEVSALCRRHGAQLAVDGIQACGIVPLDVEALGIDYLACGAHKWLMGLEGAGFVYAAPERVAALVPRTAGWLSHEQALDFLVEGPGELRYDRPVQSSLRFLEGSSMSSASLVALNASLTPILALGVPLIQQRVTAYLDLLESGLRERGVRSLRHPEPQGRSGILSVEVPAPFRAAALVKALGERSVYVSMPDGFLRFAPHFPNPTSEVPEVLAAWDEAVAELGQSLLG